ncbi:hypothetical protein N0V90_002069 [Kalmusia sp. IMI 367209]|nr:hypothetical protein N0V90_002069 [Kalmusia sp. IMI 367209]
MFAGLVHPQKMEEQEQDAVLHILMLLTKFPPAVRAVQILMRGETPQASERAAIVQCIYEVLKDIVPLRVVNNDSTRLLEGSRLLFGLVIEKAKHLKLSMHDQDQLPYVGSLKVHELRNLITMEPVISPVQTTSGLVDQDFFDAFDAGGLLRWSNENNNGLVMASERPVVRACLLSGGIKTQVISFDIDAVNSDHRYADCGDVTKVISPAEFSDLAYLAGLCGRNKVGVIHPSALPSANPPVLTLDRAGLLAVYVGRQACGQAGSDINMFRPTSAIVEESVDVSIITQLMIPILERYSANGTSVFESFGDHNRQIKDPDEVIMLCVDASSSMDSRCGFIDVEENEDATVPAMTDVFEHSDFNSESYTEDLQFDRPALDELREYLSQHESFDDMLAITQSGYNEFQRSENAAEVLEVLRLLLQQNINSKEKELEIRRGLTNHHRRHFMQNIERDLANLKNRTIRLSQYRDALIAFLLYRADNRVLDQVMTWTVGDEVPRIPKSSVLPRSDASKFEIPMDYLCPISTDLMEDPVLTVDGFTYERKNIERWLQSHETSPWRYNSISLQHQNIILIPSEEVASTYITDMTPIVVTPVEAGSSMSSSSGQEELCLVKVYTSDHQNAKFSYWEPKRTSKTLASIIFRYYRYNTSIHHWLHVTSPFIIWIDMIYNGDDSYFGRVKDHWERLSHFFTREHAKGCLANEAFHDAVNEGVQPFVNRDRDIVRPLVFKVKLAGPPQMKDYKVLSRLDVLKQMFDAYVNRLLAYGYQTHLGLVTFRTTASLTQNITHAVENFRHQLSNIRASGDTALWDALSLARDSLVQYATKYPKAKLRIICLSDGEDTKSKQPVHDVAASLVRERITVDSFCLGQASMEHLHAVSYLTGGYKFQPNQLEHAIAICELEPVLSILERPNILLPQFGRGYNNPTQRLGKAISRVKVDVVNRDSFPQRKEHPLLSESYLELGRFENGGFRIASRFDTNMRLARIRNEIRNSGAKNHPHYDIYICESNFAMWKIVMQGPPGGTYADGTFLLYLEMGKDYPMFPPKGHFVTPIYHPNINRHGRICHSIFDRNWTVDTTNKDVIDTVYSLLLTPEFSDPINTVVTLNYHWDEIQFQEELERHIWTHASKNRAQWKLEILDE